MGMNPLPPQAFTRDTLQKAYQWLLTQNASIKEMATSQDVLVSLYLKAQRDGAAALETPTIQNFKQELKSLAHLMGGLNGANSGSISGGATTASASAAASTGGMTSGAATASSSGAATAIHSSLNSPAFELPAYLPPAGANYHNQSTETSRLETPRLEASRPEVLRTEAGRQTSKLSDGTFQLDLQSLQAIADVRSQLNLGSDSEALRALIAIGYKHLKKI